MGLIDFMKSAGEKIFGSSKPTAEEMQEKIIFHVSKFNLDIDDLQVQVEDDKAILKGTAGSQADKEKLIVAVGNIEGIASVEDQITIKEEVSTPEPEAQFHTVKSGDSLSKISKEFYGDAMKYNIIFEANKPMLKDPNLIYPGQVLRIPAQ